MVNLYHSDKLYEEEMEVNFYPIAIEINPKATKQTHDSFSVANDHFSFSIFYYNLLALVDFRDVKRGDNHSLWISENLWRIWTRMMLMR